MAMSYILGLGGPYYHDASACLIDDTGKIIAFAEEERFTRRKNNKDFRSCNQSASYCLAKAGIKLDDVKEIAIAWNPNWPELEEFTKDKRLICELLDPRYFNGYNPDRLRIIDHHVAHAASAFYPSGFEEAAILIIDGSGDGISSSLFYGTELGLKLIKQYPFTQSLGWFYETVGEHLGLGNAMTSSGKLMGLAAYGRPLFQLDFITSDNDEGYFIDLSQYGFKSYSYDPQTYSNLEYYQNLKKAYKNALTHIGIPEYRRSMKYDFISGKMIGDTNFLPNHADLAASAQEALQKCISKLVELALKQTNSSRLCIAGGVALNCTANGYILKNNSQLKELFVQPVSGDAGCAIGAAMQCLQLTNSRNPVLTKLNNLALGPSFSDDNIKKAIDDTGINCKHLSGNICDYASDLLAKNKIIGWFQGQCEAGPRALGHRSILANPSSIKNRDRINRDIKKREIWRPLAPSILEGVFDNFVVNPGPADFMAIAYEANEDSRAMIPATVHIDGSLRPQIVREKVNSQYWELLEKFYSKTGVPALLNTSFNKDNEPIVCTPMDALKTFYSSPLDALIIGGYCILKDKQL